MPNVVNRGNGHSKHVSAVEKFLFASVSHAACAGRELLNSLWPERALGVYELILWTIAVV